MRGTIIFVLCLAATVLAEQVSYEGYKVYQVIPKNEVQAQVVKDLEQEGQQVIFWTRVRSVNLPVDIMVSPLFQNLFEVIMSRNEIDYSVKIENVESTLKDERFKQEIAPKSLNGRITFTQYHRYSEIHEYLEIIAWLHPHTKLESLGKSYEGREIDIFKICKDGCGTKPAVLIECGIHAREWIAPAMCLYIIQELVENKNNSAMTDNLDVYLVPVLNPDGYEYSHTHDRFWRKTRSRGVKCDGVDPNRNFDFHWCEVGSSTDECSEIYAGPKPFSEPETDLLRQFIDSTKGAIKLYLTMHSYGQYFLYPWGWTDQLPADAPELHLVADRAGDAIFRVNGSYYTVGSSTAVLYQVSGSSKDYTKGVSGIQLSYTVELPGGGSQGFDLPPERIDPVMKETWPGVESFFQYVEWKYVNV